MSTGLKQPDQSPGETLARPLFERYPTLRTKLSCIALGTLPTPVNRMARLGAELHLPSLWQKHDDLTGAIYGGNKIRKLEFLLADALQRGCSTVLTFGGLGSNHALATSINCRWLGLQCVAVLTPEPPTDAVRRTLRYHQQLGTRLELAETYADVRATAERVIAELGTQQVCEIQFGGSSWLGAIGFVNAAFELEAQIRAGELPRPDRIYVGCGTTSTTAGLALGFALAGAPIKIEGVQVTPDSVQPVRRCMDLFKQTGVELHRLDHSITSPDSDAYAVKVRRDQLGEGYAIPTPAAREAAALMQLEGMPASLTYTAKAMAALIADARAGLLRNKNVLFWNTYNSRPYPNLPDDESWRELPAGFHSVFAKQS
jgi:1-aminocyclopropane-1-carboxylate deaminase/D-cysteine desulfhydrase-like pyridoxal-dependent ACC family enzyme